MRMKKLLTFLTLLTLFFGVGWAADVTDVLNRSTTGVTGTSYTNWSGKTSNSSAVYAGNSAGGNSSIQLRSDNSNSGIVTTTSGGRVKSITVEWNSNTANGRTLDIYGKNSAYTAATDLYAVNTQGTFLGSIKKGESTSLTVTGDYEYIGLRSYSGAMYLTSITIVWETGGSSTVETVATPTFSPVAGTYTSAQDVTISCTTDGATIHYTTDGTNPTTESTEYSGAISVSENMTIKAIAVKDGMNNSQIATAEYVINLPGSEMLFERVTSISASDVGKKFVFVCESKNAAMGDVVNYGSKINVNNLSNGILTITDENVMPFTLGGSAGSWTFTNGTSLLACSSDKSLSLANNSSNATSWSISFDNNDLSMNSASVTGSKLQYNASSPRFACYSSNQTKIQLYREVETGDYTVECAANLTNGSISASPSTADAGKTITVTATPDAGYELSTVTVTPESGTAPEVTISGNSATFEMPASNVTVSATFALAWNSITSTCTPSTGGQVWVNPSGDAGVVVTDGTSTSQMGTSVTFKVVPANGFNISTVTATDESGATVNLTQGDTNESHGGWGTYYTFTMPSSAVTINATFTEGNLYIIGTANDNTWDGNIGVQMTYDTQNKVFTKDVFFSATDNGNFSFADALSGQDGSWANMGRRYGAPSNEYDLQSNGWTATWDSGKQDNSFKVPAGVYTITVNKATGSVTVAPKTVTVTLDKAAGQLETGTTVNVVSNLTSLLQACKSGVSATLAYSTDDGTSYTDGSSFPVNQAMTAKGKAYYGKIEAESDSYAYTVVTHYAVNCSVNPENCGTVTATPASAIVGENVALTINPNTGYEIGSVTVNGDEITPVDGAYSFTMPAAVANVVVNFNIIGYNITTVTTNCTIDVAPSANYNQKVTFSVTPRSDKYEVSTVTVTYGENSSKPVTDNGDGTYSFYMPASDVTLTVTCTRKSTGGNQFTLVKNQSDIVAGGEYVILETNEVYAMSYDGSNYDNPSNQFSLSEDVVTLTDGSNVSIFKLDNGSTNGTFTMQDGTRGYVTTPTSSGGRPSLASTGGNWTINYNNGSFEVKGGSLYLRYNADHFRVYTSSTQGRGVKLYKRLAATAGVEIDPATGEVIGSQVVSVGSDTDGALVQYKVEKQNGSNWDVVTDWTEWTTYTEANGPVEFTITGNVGDVYKVTARAKEADQVVDPDEEEDFDEQTVQFTFVAPNAPTITPASCSVVDVKQNVTITSEYANGVIEYSTDGGDTWNTYDGAFDVILSELGTSATVTARVTVNGVQSETVSATYTRNVQPVVFSPVSGTYYYGEQSVEMFSISQGARIYYSMTNDGSEPVDPLMNDGGTLYTGPIKDLEPGNTYKFKAYAYIGTIKSEISNAEYTIEAAHSSGYWPNIAAMNNEENENNNYYLENPVQIVYMSTYENNGRKPEFAYIRDNSGYGLVYFGNAGVTTYNNETKFKMGDWLGAGTVKGYTSVWNDGFHNELGGTQAYVHDWPEQAVGNTPIIPETVTNAQVKAGWDDSAYDESNYSSGVTSSNLWGHYIHLRNNTLKNVADRTSSDTKHKGVMTDQTGTTLTYYDVFYKFSGHNGAPHYDQSFFDARQNNGATFDFYGIVAFYGPDIANEDYAKQPFQIVPLDILWVYKPVISGVNSTDVYTTSKTVSLDLDPVQGDDESNSVIWYKTSEMEDFAIYTGPFEVSTSTTIETYTTKMTSYNDRMESVHVTMDVHFTVINPPVIAPESQVKAVGSESVNSTITRDETDELSNVTIFFTIDGSDPSDPSSERYVYNAQNQAAMLSDIRTTTTVRAVAAVGNDQDGYAYSAEAESRTYTFVKSNGIVYDLVNNINQLNSNGVYVIVSRNYSEALSNVQNTSNRGAAGVLFVDDTQAQVYGNDDVAVFTLTPLTDATDTGNEKHFLFHTSNGKTNAATGYLHVGANDDNTLLTEAEEDAMGNDVAVITIDADGRAHIHFNYSGQDNRYLQYWNRDRLFNTYKSEYDDRAVYIYYKNATPLATIEKEGVTTEGMNQYTIADELVVVWANADEGKLWCKDQGNVSIAKTEIKDGQVDYMKEVGQQHGEWDQSNWVVLQFPKPTTTENDPIKTLLNNAVGKYIEPATVTGYYIDDNNYTIQMAQAENYTLALKEGADTTKNVYCTANFLPDNLNIKGQNGAAGIYHGENRNYFFMNPKIQEVCSITFAEWTGDNTFVVPVNDAQINGTFKVDWAYNAGGPQSPAPNTAYRFVAAVQRPQGSTYLKAEQEDPIIVYPLDFTAESALPTAINTVEVGNGEIKSIKYVNVAGIVSDRPFQGVNIVVTEYTDGSRTTTKMLHK